MMLHMEYVQINCDAYDPCPVIVREVNQKEAQATWKQLAGEMIFHPQTQRWGYYCEEHAPHYREDDTLPLGGRLG